MEGWDPSDKSCIEDDDAAWPDPDDDDSNQTRLQRQNNNSVTSVKVEPSYNISISTVAAQIGGTPAAPSQSLYPNEQVESMFQTETKPQVCSTANQQPCWPQGSEKPTSSSGSAGGAKRKSVHMDALECSDMAQTETGALALTNPAMVSKSSRDSNRGLYPIPRPPRSLSQGSPQPQFVYPRKKKPTPKKISLSPSEMKNQSRLDNFFTASLRKKAATSNSSPEGEQCLKEATPTPNPAGHPSLAAASPFPKKNLNGQFASMGRSTSQPEGQRNLQQGLVRPSLAHSASCSNYTKTAVNKDMEAFENDKSFDHIDPEILDADSIPSQPSSSQSRTKKPPSTFGLLGEGLSPGSSDSDGDDPQAALGLERLSPEVLEIIFCFVPMMNTYLHLSLVCKRWNEIISKKDFMPWKKAYNRLRLNSLPDVPDHLNLIGGDLEATEGTCLLALVRSMPKFKAYYGPTMDRDLKKHPKYDLAKDVMRAKAPELLQSEVPNPWSTICFLVLLSETVQDVSRILTCLLHQTASCTTMEVMECLYCIAAYLWKYKKVFKLNGGCHYRVYHALYLFENCHTDILPPSEDSSDQGAVSRKQLTHPRHSLVPTSEQWRIINQDIERGKLIKIIALAGTGKTTTLVKYAERRPDTSFLYVAFNKSVQKHAMEIFPKNVTSRTTHSLAYKAVGYKYKKKLQSSLNPFFIHKLLPDGQHCELQWLRKASLVCKTIQQFCASADAFITTQHVPSAYHTYTLNANLLCRERHLLDHSLKMRISNDATTAWEMMINERNKEANITHDVYLKLFQLKKPWYLEYDCILIDEAQDLTPAQQDILLNQPGSKILVGDPNQQIYSFRGATNTMQSVRCDTTLHLTQSFRFGSEIAYIANCLLERAARHQTGTKQMLIGTREPGRIDGKEVGQVAIITRTNINLFTEAVKIVQANNTTMLAFAGGIDRYGMDVILDIYQIQQPENQRGFITNKYIYAHKNIQALKNWAVQTENIEMLNKIRIVEMYHVRIPELIEKIRSRTKPEAMADIVLSTAHQAKGLEYDTVKITDDFGISEANLSPLVVIDQDELNMVYVAITRAKKSLVLNRSLMKFIAEQPSWEKLVYPALATPSVCIECKTPIRSDCVMLLKRNPRKVAYPTSKPTGGLLCQKCSQELYPALSCLLG